MPKARSRLLLVLLMAVCLFGLGGVGWLLKTRPVYSSLEHTYICSDCALQRVVTQNAILKLTTNRSTNYFVSELGQTLRGGTTNPCTHHWLPMNMAHTELFCRPVPQGHVLVNVMIDLNGISDQSAFIEALEHYAATNLAGARAIWSNLLLRASRRDRSVEALKQILSDPSRKTDLLPLLASPQAALNIP